MSIVNYFSVDSIKSEFGKKKRVNLIFMVSDILNISNINEIC